MRQIEFFRFLIGLAVLFAASAAAFAGEQVLEFKLVTIPIDVKVFEAANIDGQALSAGHYVGVAYFTDGRIAVKKYIATADTLKGSGSLRGYSTYTFNDGSSITASCVLINSCEGASIGIIPTDRDGFPQ